jgi:hypothetical protein
MILSRINEYWHLLEAAKAGKTIQRLIDGKWYDVTSTDFTSCPEDYRVKPEPKLRPWRQREAPLGAWIDVWTSDQSKPSLIIGIEGAGVVTGSHAGNSLLTWERCFREGKHSIDFGNTWQRCGVEDAQ